MRIRETIGLALLVVIPAHFATKHVSVSVTDIGLKVNTLEEKEFYDVTAAGMIIFLLMAFLSKKISGVGTLYLMIGSVIGLMVTGDMIGAYGLPVSNVSQFIQELINDIEFLYFTILGVYSLVAISHKSRP